MKQNLWRLRHTANRPRREVSEVCDGPGVLVLRNHRASIRRMEKHTQEELGIRLSAVDADTVEESVEIVVHAMGILWRNHCEFAASNARFLLNFDRFVVVCNPALRTDTAPIAQNSVPYSNMLDVGMLVADIGRQILQAVGEALVVGFEVGPGTLELRFS